jgi:3-oxoacyl-[acyl-carrier-protein] synthase III
MLYIHGMGHFVPDNVIDNQFLENLDIGSSTEWILERVGIKTRRTVMDLDYIKSTKNKDTRCSLEATRCSNIQMGKAAAEMAIARAGIDRKDIGMVISASAFPEWSAPGEASLIAAELGIDAYCFGVVSGCTGYGTQVNVAYKMNAELAPPYILLVNPESFTRAIDYSDRAMACLFGDAATATVVSFKHPSKMAFTHAEAFSNPAQWEKVCAPRFGHFIQDGHAVQGFAIRKSTEILQIAQSKSDVGRENFIYVGHQGNLGMLKMVCERCNIPEENHWYNVVDYGNTASAGVPFVISQHWDELKPGTDIGISIVGAGLTWTHMLIKNFGDK